MNPAVWISPRAFSTAMVGLALFSAQAPAAVTDKPKFVPAPGTYTTNRKITLSDNSAGAAIYYTTDGSTPTTNSAQYSAPIEVSATTTLEAIAVASGDTQSAVSSGTYTITRPTDQPTFSPAPGTYTTPQKITLSDKTSGAVIYYTTDGSTPTTSSAQYHAPIEVKVAVRIDAIAVASGDSQSAVSSGTYSIARPTDPPTLAPAPGTYTTPQTITISDQTAGAVIYYTTDGSTPTTSSTEYTAPVEVDATAKIKAIAAANGHSQSAVSSAYYAIDDYSVVLRFGNPGGVAEGQCPAAALIQGTDGNFYGTTESGGLDPYEHDGVVFTMTPDGVESVLHTFGGAGDGIGPEASLIQGSDGNFYGTTSSGGAYASATDPGGTVFKITLDGVETVLHSFGGASDGVAPAVGLIQGSDGNFYGTTAVGGAYLNGTVFKITSAGIETLLYSFSGMPDGNDLVPDALIQASDGNFYGTTLNGGAYGNGMIFKLTPAGVESVLYSFSGTPDGNNPDGLTQGSDGNLYGTTEGGGANSTSCDGYGCGTVFKLTLAGVETVLHSFGGTGDGVDPVGGLIQGNDGNFFGTTYQGGTARVGTVFEITPTGLETVLHSIGDHDGGAMWPEAGLLQASDGNFYGTTCSGTGMGGLQGTPMGWYSSSIGRSRKTNSIDFVPQIRRALGTHHCGQSTEPRRAGHCRGPHRRSRPARRRR